MDFLLSNVIIFLILKKVIIIKIFLLKIQIKLKKD